MKESEMTSPRTLLQAWNIRADKRLGQHFLTDPATAAVIVQAAAISSRDVVLEIGAGLGALTILAARQAARIYAVEKDARLADLLRAEFMANGINNVVLMKKNILRVDIRALAAEAGVRLVVIGNLPYNISSQILVQLISVREAVKQAVLMFQMELAERLTAGPGGRDYGRLSVMIQYCAELKPVGRVTANRFFPRPKVDSAVLSFVFKTQSVLSPEEEDFFFKVIRAAFGRRRKKLRNSLAGSELGLSTEAAQQALERAHIDPSRRAETLDVAEFLALSASLNQTLHS
ncbi:MAG: 16S rRNA (adenine(1518)-N(6)/adenine(1519)-N(6))-dimethyltransferase RsmA [Desulfobacterales bacterium]